MASRDVLPLLKGALGTAPKLARRRQDALHKLTLRRRQILDRKPDRVRAEVHAAGVSDQPDAVAQLREALGRLAQGYEPKVFRAAVAVLMEEITEGQGAYRARLTLPKFRLVFRGLRATLRRSLGSWEYPAQ